MLLTGSVQRRPPVAFAKIAAVPPAKKLLIIPGITIGRPNSGHRNIPIIVPTVVKIKPYTIAFGA